MKLSLCTALLAALPVHAQSITGRPKSSAPFQVPTAAYQALTDDLAEFANFHPEPFAGIAIDVDGGILAVNPYNNTWVKYAGPTATSLSLRVQTGHAPVSIGVWNPGPTSAQRKVVVVSSGSHALFVHDPADGRVLDALLLDDEPADLAIDQENGWAFVSCRGDGTVLKVDLAPLAVLDRYRIGCGRRPGPLHLDPGSPTVNGDTRVYVAPMITGNNSLFALQPGQTVGQVVDLDGSGIDLPDEDVFRIDPFQPPANAVAPVVKRAGSLIFDVARHPGGDLWILSTDSNNKSALDSEPEIQGKIVVNQLVTVPGVGPASTLVTAGPGIDLDDYQPSVGGAQYDPAQSVNQARTLAFQPDGDAFVASPMSAVIARLDAAGQRTGRLDLPARAQCYALRVYDPDPSIVLALCLGTMTIEVFSEASPSPGRPLPLGNDPTPPSVRRGRDIVLDGKISQDARSSCFACHEGGRTDMLGWSIAGTPTDIKDVMVTQSLLGIADTFPHHWRGERDLDDFRKAFVGLLGAPEALAPTPEQMQDVNAFFRSLRAPANPRQSYRRLLDDKLVEGPSPNGFTGSAVAGQTVFTTVENFNGNTCAECHGLFTGSNGNMFFEVGSFAPRAQELEVPHLRQLQHKDDDAFPLPGGGLVNENGFGTSHNGLFANVFEFIESNFPQLTPQEHADAREFVKQFDQGSPPGCHWAGWFRHDTPRIGRDVQEILIASAEAGWLDIVVFGRFDDGAGPLEVRWLYDSSQDLFVNDHPLVGDKTWAQFKAATAAGMAENAFLGVPLGNGFRLAFDPDADDLRTGDELALGTNPWGPDTDRDGWPDGYEVENGENPLVPQASPGDDFQPAVLASGLEFATARAAKYQVRFSEDVRYVVSYSLSGGPTLAFTQPDLVRADTFVLTHSAPSTPLLGALNKPDPDGTTVFSASITITDRAGKVTGPLPLAQTFTPLAAQVQGGVPPFTHVASITASVLPPPAPDTLEAILTLEPNLHYGAPSYIDGEGLVLFCNVAVQDPATKLYAQSQTFTTNPPLATQFSTLTPLAGGGFGPPVPFTAIPGPFVVCPPAAGGTTQFTLRQPGLVPGQKVKVAVQGVLIPVDLAQQHYDESSLFMFQPLLTEEFHELELTF